ncbi:putative hotdog family 3-hydroxylacyl-ACP dehydratase [Luteibacter rhizovicinus]|uniref:Putative hotdog family 3-hydroxylacyl-ACP dehydratase n=1 Tax=Luteibacter rhizovicinus TaxID=242606 RepID=A0A4R3YUJ7_9GAMM|nr:phosphotransferase [Luteibacter rhizovicinus]TCV96271.1 putative hotdog family 3-hydroxylacyl-ACP dehydratase [Luteibacter rhizovicinus]
MLDKTDWMHLVPHAGDMCLLDVVLAWDERTIHARSTNHTMPSHPLRGDHGLHAVHLSEYGAQAMAVHGALRARAAGGGAARPGMLVSLRGVDLAVERVDTLEGALDIHAECLYADDSGAQYTFRIEHDGVVVASGRAAVIHP